VRIIREQDILKHFPGRTEADLYLWIMDHQHFLREQFGPQVQPEEAARHFTDRYSARLLHRLARLGRRLLRRNRKKGGDTCQPK